MSYSDIAKQIAGDNGLDADCDDSGAALETHAPGQRVRPGLPLRARPADRVRLPRRGRRRSLFKQPVESHRRAGRGRLQRATDPRPARLERQPARVPGADERRRPGRRGQGPRLGRQGEAGGHRPGGRDRDQRRALDSTPKDLADKIGGETLLVRGPPGRAPRSWRTAWRERGRSRSAARRSRRPRSPLGSPALKAGVAVSVAGIDPALEGKWVDHRLAPRVRAGRLPDAPRVHRAPGPLHPGPRRAGRRRAPRAATSASSWASSPTTTIPRRWPGSSSSSRG